MLLVKINSILYPPACKNIKILLSIWVFFSFGFLYFNIYLLNDFFSGKIRIVFLYLNIVACCFLISFVYLFVIWSQYEKLFWSHNQFEIHVISSKKNMKITAKIISMRYIFTIRLYLIFAGIISFQRFFISFCRKKRNQQGKKWAKIEIFHFQSRYK